MTPDRFKSIRTGAGLTCAQLERRLRLADHRGGYVRKMENGHRPISGPIALCMECLDLGVLP